jgi:hypothetical protein
MNFEEYQAAFEAEDCFETQEEADFWANVGAALDAKFGSVELQKEFADHK